MGGSFKTCPQDIDAAPASPNTPTPTAQQTRYTDDSFGRLHPGPALGDRQQSRPNTAGLYYNDKLTSVANATYVRENHTFKLAPNSSRKSGPTEISPRRRASNFNAAQTACPVRVDQPGRRQLWLPLRQLFAGTGLSRGNFGGAGQDRNHSVDGAQVIDFAMRSTWRFRGFRSFIVHVSYTEDMDL